MLRRNFIQHTAALGAGLSALSTTAFSQVLPKERKFHMCLAPGKIGVDASQRETLQLAHSYGFDSMVAFPSQLAKMSASEIQELLVKMKEQGIKWGTAGLPIEFRKDRNTFEQDLAALPKMAQACETAGVKGMGTWILPMHDSLTYQENFYQTAERLAEVAMILGHYGIKLGLEYVAPKTMMVSRKFSFVRTLSELKELIEQIGKSNVGVVLDSFHWYCAGDTVTDILSLDKTDIVTCDLNDARPDLGPDKQIDGKRELPSATGVIDLKAFLTALVQIGYDGPVRAEPFNKALNELDNDAAVQATYEAMKRSIDLV
ncbi:MAG: sugar phosphate isomerase/epimerase family protein [Bacteroidota bacterium]